MLFFLQPWKWQKTSLKLTDWPLDDIPAYPVNLGQLLGRPTQEKGCLIWQETPAALSLSQKAQQGEKPAKGGDTQMLDIDTEPMHRTIFVSWTVLGCSEDHDPRTDWDYFFLCINMFCTSKILCKPDCQICRRATFVQIIVKKNNNKERIRLI